MLNAHCIATRSKTIEDAIAAMYHHRIVVAAEIESTSIAWQCETKEEQRRSLIGCKSLFTFADKSQSACLMRSDVLSPVKTFLVQ